MAIFLVGKSGFIAARLAARLHGLDHLFFTSSRGDGGAQPLDLAHPEIFDFDAVKNGDRVLMLAAVSSPDICQNDLAYARSVNVDGTIRFVGNCLKRGARVVFFSSDTVYGGGGPFDEFSPCRPIGSYAEMKHEVESRFQGKSAFKTLRLSYVMSLDDKFTSYLHHCSASGEEANVFHPLRRRAVHIDDLADAVAAVCQNWDSLDFSVLNVAGPELLSRVDMAELFQSIDPRLHFRVTEPGQEFFAARPQTIDMGSCYLSTLLGREPRTLREALAKELSLQDAKHDR
ncbi:MAG: sugar nucleotide-binding protein [Sulfuricella sp.]|nr:sugar nucleotide-binding protein [Sulfuricella sp.]